MDVVLDEGADLPAHEVGEGQEHSEREGWAGFAGEADAEDQREDDDDAGQGSPRRRGGDADGGDEETERGDAEHLGEQGGGSLTGDVDGGRIGIHAVVVHCHGVLQRCVWQCGLSVLSSKIPLFCSRLRILKAATL